MVKREYEKAFIEIKKIVKDEFFNFYLVYRKIKRSYLGAFPKKEFVKVLQLCKKYKLNCVYEKNMYKIKNKKRIIYSCMISYENISKNIFKLENKKYFTALGLSIGYPVTCVKTFGKRKNNYGHSIMIKYKLKNNKKIQTEYNVYYFMCNKPLKKHMKDFKKQVVNEIKNNLSNIFSYISIRYEIEKYDFSKKYMITENNTKLISQGTTTFGKKIKI